MVVFISEEPGSQDIDPDVKSMALDMINSIVCALKQLITMLQHKPGNQLPSGIRSFYGRLE